MASATGRQPTRTVFLGDIPYDFGEAEVWELTNRCPFRPLEVRLVWDRERNRHKGYGFIEYDSVEQAIQARDSLNGLAVKSRKLRADYSNDPKNGGSSGGSNRRHRDQSQQQPQQQQPKSQQQQPSTLPAPPAQQYQQSTQPNAAGQSQQIPIPRNLVANDNISRTLAQFHPNELLNAIEQMKTLMQQNQAQAYTILKENQSLSYALVQAMLLMGLVDANVVSQAASQTTNGAISSHTPTPVAPTPPPPQSQPPQQQQQPQQDPSQDEMIRQVLALTEEQINSLPEDQRAMIIALRQQHGK